MKVLEASIHILSRTSTPFRDREEAGLMLAEQLKVYSEKSTVVLGIPRGGMVIAGIIAGSLGAELDLVISRKLRSPWNPELAIGAVTEDGSVFLDERLNSETEDLTPYIKREKNFQLREIARRAEIFRAVKSKVPLKNKVVIITDDGLATGATMRAAVQAARGENPVKIIVAVPVAPEDSLLEISAIADEIVCLRAPRYFNAIGQFYVNFEQVEDAEVIDLLKNTRGVP